MSQTQLLDSCLLVNRKIQKKEDKSVTLTEITERGSNKMTSLLNDGTYSRQNACINSLSATTMNNYASNSPNSSHISIHSDESMVQAQKQQSAQQQSSSSLTKVVNEMQHTIQSNSPIDYQTLPIGMYPHQVPVTHVRQQPYVEYGSIHPQYDPHLYSHLPEQQQQQQQQQHYKDYETYPVSSADYLVYGERAMTPSEQSVSPSPHLHSHHQQMSVAGGGSSNYDTYHRLNQNEAVTAAAAALLNEQHIANDSATLYGYTSSPYGTAGMNVGSGGSLSGRSHHGGGGGGGGGSGLNGLNAAMSSQSHLANAIYGNRASVATAATSVSNTNTLTYKNNMNLVVNGGSVGSGAGSVSGLNGNANYEDDLQKHFQQLNLQKQQQLQQQQQQQQQQQRFSPDMHMHSNYGVVSSSAAAVGSVSGGGATSNLMLDDKQQQQAMRWRDPNLTEVIGFLDNPNNVVKANAAAYLQHLCYMDDANKQKTRMLGGIPPLVKLLYHDNENVCRNACGALRNISYGRQNDENKRAIRNAGGLSALVALLSKTSDADIKELLTGVVWNMSSCDDLKRDILDDAFECLVREIILQHSGWNGQANLCSETCFSTIFRNASGVIRNISSAGEHARKKLREYPNLIESLVYVLKYAVEKLNIGNKIVENTCCILRNVSYRCQEIEDLNYDKTAATTTTATAANTTPSRLSATLTPKSDNLGCFGTGKKKKDSSQSQSQQPQSVDNYSYHHTDSNDNNISGTAAAAAAANSNNNSLGGTATSTTPTRRGGAELLWQPEVVQLYLTLLQSCSNPETLEAAAGAIQNLAACYWQPSIDVRATVRKEKGLPILVELLRMEVDRVVCAVATALRNLAIDQRNKELIGKYAMRDLVQKLPSGNSQHDQGTSDDTIAAVLATLNEVIKKNAEFSRSLLETGGIERLMIVSKNRGKYSARVIKFSSQLLFTMWQHQELREVYKKHGWKEQDFVPKAVLSTSSSSTSAAAAAAAVAASAAASSSTSIAAGALTSTATTASLASITAGSGGGAGTHPNLVPNSSTSTLIAAAAATAANSNSPNNANMINNNTLNRPMASQSTTRYEDRTIKRGGAGAGAGTASTSSSAAVLTSNQAVAAAAASSFSSQRNLSIESPKNEEIPMQDVNSGVNSTSANNRHYSTSTITSNYRMYPSN